VSTTRLAILCAFLGSALAGCRQDMHDQPRYKPLAESDFFGDDRSARPLLPDTIARGHLKDDALLWTGVEGGKLAERFPFAVDAGVMRRGAERYGVFCTPCHGALGRGDGMVVRRGYRRPPSFHVDRLRQAPPGHYFDVMTKGFGAMPDYAEQIPVRDRWAIAAYIRALQLSQNATLQDVAVAERGRLTGGKQ
jgi:mono/diheme cytochrome c family protein